MTGRAARNERRKLRATFYNGLALGFALGGVFVPYLGIIPKAPAIAHWIEAGFPMDRDVFANVFGTAIGFGIAAFGAWLFRRASDQIASHIEGD